MEMQTKPIKNKKKRGGWYLLPLWLLVGGLAALSIHPLHEAFNPLFAGQTSPGVTEKTTQSTTVEAVPATSSNSAVHDQRSEPSATPPALGTATGPDDEATSVSVAEGLSRTLRNAANAVLPSVVSIQHTIAPAQVSAVPGQGGTMQDVPWQGPMADPLFRQFFGEMRPMQREPEHSLGSGVVIDPSGVILTNNHVVEGGGTITVRLHDGREFDAVEVQTDPKTDLAVVRIKNAKDLAAATLGDSDDLRLGDWVIAVGDPFGLSETVTAGIISAKGRGLGITNREEFLQTDAAINPGNSGGPLVNALGEVVGINTAISSTTGGYQGIGFAIPINLAKWVSDQLIAEGRVHRAFLGVGIQALTPDLASQFGIPGKKGVVVTKVFPDTPGSEAGLKSGDVIVAYDDHALDSPRQLQAHVEESTANSSHELKLIRGGKETKLSVTVLEQPADYGNVASRGTENGDAQQTDVTDLGIHVIPLSEETRKELRIHDVEGVVIASVEAGSLADEAGLTPAMVIARVGKTPVTNVSEFVTAMKKESLEQGVLLLVQRGDASMFVVIRRR